MLNCQNMTFSSKTSQFSTHSPRAWIGRLVISVIDSALQTAKLAKLFCGIVYRRQAKVWCEKESVPRDLLHAIPMLSPFSYWNSLLRVVTVCQSDSPKLSHPPAPRKLSTPSMPMYYSSKCQFSSQIKVISLVFYLWSQSIYSTEASFQIQSKIYQRHGSMSPRKFGSKPKVDFLISLGAEITNSHNYHQPTWRTPISIQNYIQCQ